LLALQAGFAQVCNAIYSVSRTCPVYFDRHTLSVKDDQLSMYTLDGRMLFALALQAADEANFKAMRLR